MALAQELFADLFAGLRVGPAFFLSLYEMSWGTNQHLWSVRLSPRDESIQAYPSSRFRLDCLREATGLDAFEAGAAAAFRGLKALSARDMASFAGSLSTDHEDDVVEVYPPSSEDHTVLRAVLQDHLTLIKECCLSFLGSCRGYLHDEYGQRFGRVDPRAVAELLRRLENDIVPNVVPDGTLLGTPADFQTILNASALFRLSMLRDKGGQPDSPSVGEDIRRVERLTEKALEVSYVQHAYRHWLAKGRAQ